MVKGKVVIITLNYNQNEYTRNCVESILRSDYDDFDILLIDNGSTEENFMKLQKILPHDDRLKLFRLEKNRGYVGGINYGLQKAEKILPEFILIMNNDTVIDPEAIKELVATERKYQNKAIVTGKVYHYDRPDVLQDVGYYFKNGKSLAYTQMGNNEKDEGQYDNESERDLLDDVFWVFPFKLYEKIGGYSPYFWFNYEQADFALRAKKVGYKLIYTPKARLWHKGSVSIGGRELNPQLAYWEMQSSLIFNYIHLKKGGFLKLFLEKIIITSKITLKAVILKSRGNSTFVKYAYAKRRGLRYFLKWMIVKNNNIGEIPAILKTN